MHVRDASILRLPANAEAQKQFESSAARAAQPGRWNARAPLPFPRSEMASAAAWNGRMHVVGGFGNLRVDRAYHHIYDAAKNVWSEAAALPRGASHIGVASANGLLYAIGGFIEQNRLPHEDAFAFDITKGEWRTIAPLPRARAAACVVNLQGKIHVIAGASGRDIRKSVDWHEVYDPAADRWETRAPLPDPRDHAGAEVLNGRIHVMGGGFDGSNRNTDLHHVYEPKSDSWEKRAPLPRHRRTARENFFNRRRIGRQGARPERSVRWQDRPLGKLRTAADTAPRCRCGGDRQRDLFRRRCAACRHHFFDLGQRSLYAGLKTICGISPAPHRRNISLQARAAWRALRHRCRLPESGRDGLHAQR